jgi:hypothetical protein
LLLLAHVCPCTEAALALPSLFIHLNRGNETKKERI